MDLSHKLKDTQSLKKFQRIKSRQVFLHSWKLGSLHKSVPLATISLVQCVPSLIPHFWQSGSEKDVISLLDSQHYVRPCLCGHHWVISPSWKFTLSICITCYPSFCYNLPNPISIERAILLYFLKKPLTFFNIWILIQISFWSPQNHPHGIKSSYTISYDNLSSSIGFSLRQSLFPLTDINVLGNDGRKPWPSSVQCSM